MGKRMIIATIVVYLGLLGSVIGAAVYVDRVQHGGGVVYCGTAEDDCSVTFTHGGRYEIRPQEH